jgi:nucleoside-diphosphate-sugar epimerase
MEARSDRHVLVVGGAGYVGNVLVRRLLSAGHRVRVLDGLIFGHGSALAGVSEESGFAFVRGDVRDLDAVERSLEGITDVVMLAALVGDPISKAYPELTVDVNEGSKRALELIGQRSIDRFVFTSTCSNYGLRSTDDPATEDSELSPLSLYAEMKVDFEQHLLALEDPPFSPTILRIATAYGLSQRMRFDLTISEFTRTLTIGEELVVYDADTWRPYCHVGDISKAIMTVLEAPAESVRGEVFNVGHDDENYTKRMVVDVVQEHLGGCGRVQFTEGGQDARNYKVSFEKIQRVLDYEPDHRVPGSTAELIAAIEAGVFDDVAERPGFYGNREVVEAVPASVGGR